MNTTNNNTLKDILTSARDLVNFFDKNKKAIFEPMLNKLFIAMRDIEDTKKPVYLNKVLDSIDYDNLSFLLSDSLVNQFKNVLNNRKGCNPFNYSCLIRKIKEEIYTK